MPHPANPISLVAFGFILLFVLGSLLFGVYFASKKTKGPAVPRTIKLSLGVGFWLCISCGIVQSGFLADQPFPRVFVFFGLSNLLGIALALSPIGGWLVDGLSIRTLLAFQGFRIPLEAVLYSWAAQGTIPETMTWAGSNFDVISGIVALAVAFIVPGFKVFAWIANVVGFTLLLNVMRVAIMSSPFDWAWGVEPPLVVAFHLPYALIVPICVAGALAGHVLITRALIRNSHGSLKALLRD